MRSSETYRASTTWAVPPAPAATWTAASAPATAPRTAPSTAAVSDRGSSYDSGGQGRLRATTDPAAAAKKPTSTTVQPEVTRYFAGTSALGKRKHPSVRRRPGARKRSCQQDVLTEGRSRVMMRAPLASGRRGPDRRVHRRVRVQQWRDYSTRGHRRLLGPERPPVWSPGDVGRNG